MSITKLTAALAAVGIIAALPAGASAASKARSDRDRDGLSAKTEKRLGTNPRRADTDRDKLKDGAEVKLGTNPLRKDSDRDGVNDGAEVAAGTDPCPSHANQVRGAVASVGADSVTITKADATTVTLTVNADTKLRIPDRDADGKVTLADLQAGDKVNARTSAADATIAESIAVKGGRKRGEEVEGVVVAVAADSLTITTEDGSTVTLAVNADTKIKAPDRDASGSVTIADVLIGDKVEAYSSADDAALALAVKVEATKVAGTVAEVGTDSVTITLEDQSTVTVTVNADTKLRIPAADGSATGTLADLTVGEDIRAKTIQGAGGTTLALGISAGSLIRGGEGQHGHGHGHGHGPGHGEDGNVITQNDRGGRGGRGR
jgi:ribosome maturation factor RimP